MSFKKENIFNKNIYVPWAELLYIFFSFRRTTIFLFNITNALILI
jgi:hypothetical protein